MGEARAKKKQKQKKGDAADLRWIPIRNEDRWVALTILRDCAAESKEEKRHIFKAIAALDYTEDEKDAVDDRTEKLIAAFTRYRAVEGKDPEKELELREAWKTLRTAEKKWKRETEVIALSTETIKTLSEQLMGYKKMAGGGAEILVPWVDMLEEKSKAPEGDPCRTPPEGFYEDADGQ